ncbi:MAG TPA: ABC transporter permease [Chloroflexia bacterium]|nr:ABC transporter permease [Chloroflexia bacterium]
MICGVPTDVLIVTVLATTMRVATPLVLGALGGLFCERSGVVNIAIEGMMIMGAFSAFVAGVLTGSLWWGVLAAMLSAALLAALHALLSVTFRVDQIISGTVINILAFGITIYLYDQYYSTGAPTVKPLPTWSFPGLADIPVFGRLFQQQPIVWASLLLVAVVHFVLFYTRWGLRTRAVGEHPRAADTVGINVYFMRYANVIIGGAVAGLAGAYLIAEVPTFSPGITTGRGFIALAALIFGKWTPFGAWGAALLFGLASAAQINLQQCGMEIQIGGYNYAQLIGILPYVVTIVVLAGVVGRSTPPAAVGVPYEK